MRWFMRPGARPRYDVTFERPATPETGERGQETGTGEEPRS
jgi:hypothetical protein